MFELLAEIGAGLGSPAGLIISTLALLAIALLIVQGVKAALRARCDDAAERRMAIRAPAKPTEQPQESEWREAA